MVETIKSIVARSIEVPLATPVWVGGYAVEKRDYCLLEITTNEGRKGHALSFSRGGDLAGAVMRHCAPHLLNQDVEQVEKVWETIYQKNRLNGRQGILMRALSLVDLALWDLKAKKANLPLYQLLGGYRESVPVMMAGGYYTPDHDLSRLVQEFEAYIEGGYKHVKLMVGGASLEEDLERFVTLRKALPKDVSLAVDANGSWNDAKAVLRWMDKAETMGGEIAFIEEPLPPEDMEGTCWLKDQSSVPLATGEFMSGRWAFKELLQKRGADLIRADATMCGGITEWKRIAALSEAWNIPVIPHYFPFIHLHLGIAFPACKMIEAVSTNGRNSSFESISGKNYEVKNGCAYPKGFPGFGYDLNEDFIDFHTQDIQTVK